VNLLFDYMVNGIDTKEEFGFEADYPFTESLFKHLSEFFNDGETFRACPMNKNNYFLCIEEDDYKEIFGYEIVDNRFFFIEGIYMPQEINEVPSLLDLMSEIIKFCIEYSEKEEDSDEDTECDFEWI